MKQKTDDTKAEKLAIKWNVGFCEIHYRGKDRIYVHGNFSTMSDTKLEAITKYLK